MRSTCGKSSVRTGEQQVVRVIYLFMIGIRENKIFISMIRYPSFFPARELCQRVSLNCETSHFQTRISPGNL